MPDNGIYLDYAATTPVDPQVATGMAAHLTCTGTFGNPHSTSHRFGLAAHRAVEDARREVAGLIGAADDEIIFTSGATEAINLATKGVMLSSRAHGRHVLVSALDHKAALSSASWLAGIGFDVEFLQPNDVGLVTAESVKRQIRADTALVSMMHVNNEVGTITDVGAVARVVRQHAALFHVDAAQSVSRLPLDVSHLDVDLLSLSGHKMYGPKGVGSLYVRRDIRRLLEPHTHGGGQEGDLRSGTLPTHQLVGFGIAAKLMRSRREDDARRIRALDERLLRWITSIDGAEPNGSQAARVPGILNVAFRDVEAESLMLAIGDIAVSAGSACTSAEAEPSHVLLGLGLSEAGALSSIRISLGRHTTADHIDTVGHRLRDAVTTLRSIAA